MSVIIREHLVCSFDDEKRIPHNLMVVKWRYSDNIKCNTAKHATQLLCQNCFTLFDFQAISDYHVVHQCKDYEIGDI